jgi:iron complex transport system substrate-binding protein
MARPRRLTRYPSRIVCLTEETCDTLYLLGEGRRVISVSSDMLVPASRRRKMRVSASIRARLERIEALNPDLVLGFSDGQAELGAELVRRGHPVMVFNQRSVDEILQMVRMLGALVGAGGRADAIVAGLRRGLDDIREAAATLPRRPRVFFEQWNRPLVCGVQWIDELIEIAGGEPIFPELRRTRLTSERVVDPTEVARRNPDAIVASWCGRPVRKEQIAARPGWQTISAVRRGEIHELKSSCILQPGPSSLTVGVGRLHEIVARVARTQPPAHSRSHSCPTDVSQGESPMTSTG